MIKNFEVVKDQLRELSEVINSFKSEAVQLKIIELILDDALSTSNQREQEVTNDEPPRRKRRKSKTRITPEVPNGEPPSRKPRVPSGSGAIATLRSVYANGFFKEPRTIGHILEHCETNLARKIKANEISGTLARMVRNNQLSRKKNEDGQYEYRELQA